MKSRNAVLVVAHPDDEVLWFSSILPSMNRVIFAFLDCAAEPELGDRRRSAIAALPYANLVNLGIPESGSLCLADWATPEPYPCGMRLTAAASDVIAAYERNFQAVQSALAEQLADATEVYTHNPWGEYGHEDHVQIYRAIEGLQPTIGFQLFASGYGSRRALPLASTYWPLRVSRPHRVDASFASFIADIYKQRGCWTWAEDWIWPDGEWFFRGPFKVSPSPVLGSVASCLSHLPDPLSEKYWDSKRCWSHQVISEVSNRTTAHGTKRTSR